VLQRSECYDGYGKVKAFTDFTVTAYLCVFIYYLLCHTDVFVVAYSCFLILFFCINFVGHLNHSGMKSTVC